MKSLLYKIENDSYISRYVFEFVLNIMGVAGKHVDDGANEDQVDIYYGSNPGLFDYKIRIIENRSHVLWNELLDGGVTVDAIDRIVPFDLINAIGAFLSDAVNSDMPNASYDMHDRLIYERSYQGRNGIGQTPIVNTYVTFLKALLEKRNVCEGVSLWPNGKRYAVGLSHDVDIPDKYAVLKAPHYVRGIGVRRNLLLTMRKAKGTLKRLCDGAPGSYWLFGEVMDAEERLGFTSTFFFAVVNQYDSPYSTEYDVCYNPEAPEYMEVIREIVSRGFEVGLHASYDAHVTLERFVSEKEMLEKLSPESVRGLRHHYWRMGRDVERVLDLHEKAGFQYDSSIAFNELPGFRRSVAFPYRPWKEDSIRGIDTMQFPVVCMDESLFRECTGMSEAVEKLKTVLRVIKESGGLGVIDWHVRTSCPRSPEHFFSAKTYLEILEYLSLDGEVWVTSLGDLNSWLRERERVLWGIL